MLAGEPGGAAQGHGAPASTAAASVDDTVLASWRRSRAWVSPEVTEAPVDRADVELARWRSSPVAAGVRSVEAEIRRAVDDADLVAAVTDRSGRIMWTSGSRVMRSKAERVNFVPGGRWDEASVGTNALALALRTGRPSTVYSAEHFSRAVHGWVCYSVPLNDPGSGDVLGVLDLSTTWDRAHPLALGAAIALGQSVVGAMPRHRPAAGVRLRVLGRTQVDVGGTPLMLPQRQVEVLLLLSLHPDGLSLGELHARLYGDSQVSVSTLKAEVSHLRGTLDGAIGSRPYRVLVPVHSDVQAVLDYLAAGRTLEAVRTAHGPLLPDSESPDVAEWREYVEVALRTAVLRCDDVDAVLAYGDRHPYDEQVLAGLSGLLPADDPRQPVVQARLHRASC